MDEIKTYSPAQSVEQTAAPRKSQSLRLDKQTIRTLSGAELKLVGGGLGCDCSCGCHTQHTQIQLL